ncbi:MAG: sensor domain-containing diguanylate cyclase [Geminicoccaceae bacterium]|nr:sensor domain-containing diguanylate cyclase [Geminicoccaceae bacterium]MCS7267491.1 sensor domain-containing diguanylate cyclase [Geminicoccaceae bacterium]MCX7629173.1 sensor domain-containing diguanylate cyclase [Geminicoccaceae bacterium]MDW8123695.1 sensor domain-containing diguanylate cyclase [Geminicoccaceae bacterium]MDW8342026.1 sensor domain-containing diguanylate cyclase [Geminicoccaceae bacterium]
MSLLVLLPVVDESHRHAVGGSSARSRTDRPRTAATLLPRDALLCELDLASGEGNGEIGPDEELGPEIVSLFGHLPEAILVVDAHRLVRHANEAAVRLWGEPENALVGRALDELLEAPETVWNELFARPGLVVDMLAKRAAGARLPVEVAAGPPGFSGRPLRILAVRDATARFARETAIARLALFDPLTGLPNRLVLEDRLHQAIARADRYGGLVALHLLDLDGFKAINDSHGHRVGDAVLVAFARQLKPAIRSTDTLARIGGDEFAFLQCDLQNLEGARLAAERLLARLAAPLSVGPVALTVRASIGTAVYPLHGRETDLLFERADRALYTAKSRGGGVVVIAETEEEAGTTPEEGPEAD